VHICEGAVRALVNAAVNEKSRNTSLDALNGALSDGRERVQTRAAWALADAAKKGVTDVRKQGVDMGGELLTGLPKPPKTDVADKARAGPGTVRSRG